MKKLSILLLIAGVLVLEGPHSSAANSFRAHNSNVSSPSILCPADIVQGTDSGESTARVHFTVIEADNSAGADPVCEPPSDSAFPVGVTVVLCVASDFATCSFTVTIRDLEPPQMVCPSEIALTTPPGSCSVVANFQVQAEDLLPGLRLFCFPPAGSTFPVGATMVNCAATDAAGNRTTCSFAVKIVERDAPIADFTPGPNPSGKNVPGAGNNQRSGLCPDGFCQLSCRDGCDPNPKIYIKDSASRLVAGPFRDGDKVKITQAPGATASQTKMAGGIIAHLKFIGDALIYAVDSSGNVSPTRPCKVPPPPK